VKRVRQILVGVATDPAVVGAARAFTLSVLPFATAVLVAYLSGVRDPRWAGIALAAVPVIRALEGAVDRALKPQSNAIDPPRVAGSGGGDPSR
jgi:hypothetical protein